MHLISNRKFNFEHLKKGGGAYVIAMHMVKEMLEVYLSLEYHLPVTVIVRGRQLFEVPISLRVKKKKQNSKGNKIIS